MKYLLLYNPISGRAKVSEYLNKIETFFKNQQLHIDFYESKKPHDLEKEAYKQASNYDVFIAAGGDGTVNEVVNGIMKSDVRPILGVLPFGTANDIAGILKIPKNINKALKLFIEQEPIKMDINQINERYFVYTVASGVLTRISYDISRRQIQKYGYLAYVFEGAKDLLNDYRFPIDITYNDKTLTGEFMMVLGMCSTRVGGFRLKYFSKPKLNDGLLELMLFRRVKHFRLFKILSFFLKRGRSLKENEKIKSSSFIIKTDPDVVWNADGELSTKGSIDIKVLQQQIYVYAHPKIKRTFF